MEVSKFSQYISQGSIRADALEKKKQDNGAKRQKSLDNGDSDYKPESKTFYREKGEFRYLYGLFPLDETATNINLFFTFT